MHPENANLVFRLQHGSTEAFRTIYNLYFTRILVYSSGYVADKYIAQEMTQDTFVKLWEKSDSLPDDTMFQPLLYRIARNNCLNYLKHLKVTEKYMKHQANHQSENELSFYALSDESSQRIICEELENKIQNTMASLPPACKKVFELSRLEEKKHSEIAENLGIAIKTVENQIHKALKIMRRELKDYLPILILYFLF